MNRGFRMEFTVFGSGSSGNCYRIQDGTDTLLLEAGLPFKQMREALSFRLSTLAGVLVSHSHGDHAKGVKDLVKAGVDVYCHPDTAQEIGVSGHRVHTLEPLKTIQVGGFYVMPFPLVHDISNYGYLVAKGRHKLVYMTDTQFCPYRFEGLTHVAIETNHAADILWGNVRQGHIPPSLGKRIRETHMSLETAKGFLQANDLSRVEQVFLLHLSSANSDEARFKREVQEITGCPVYVG